MTDDIMGADEGRARTRALNLPESEQQSGASYYGAGGEDRMLLVSGLLKAF